MQNCSVEAWNNFVMLSDPASYGRGTSRRAAALANLFMGVANNGGLNHFLEATSEFDAQEVEAALLEIGARKAAGELAAVLAGLGVSMPAMSQDQRWAILEENWTEPLDALDVLSSEADEELMTALGEHVAKDEAFYLALAQG
ncbi:MAG: methionyl-tRNA formyltransferase [Sphingomonas bacterium]|nr:methionyl-tRNA formyltransferase [Sphingomonas bacterium]